MNEEEFLKRALKLHNDYCYDDSYYTNKVDSRYYIEDLKKFIEDYNNDL